MENFKCVICGNSVSKRKSLAYSHETIDQGKVEGRACRHHEQVLHMVSDKQMEESMKKIEDSLRIISAVSFFRVMRTFGWPKVLVDIKLRRILTVDQMRQVYEEVLKQGEFIKDEEMTQSIIMNLMLQGKIKGDDK